MAKIGDHVKTSYGNGTVISDKRVMIHGVKNKIISYAGDKDRDKSKRVIKGVIRTRLQVEQVVIDNHKQFVKSQKSIEKKEKEDKEVKKVRKAKEVKEEETPKKKRTKKEVVI